MKLKLGQALARHRGPAANGNSESERWLRQRPEEWWWVSLPQTCSGPTQGRRAGSSPSRRRALRQPGPSRPGPGGPAAVPGWLRAAALPGGPAGPGPADGSGADRRTPGTGSTLLLVTLAGCTRPAVPVPCYGTTARVSPGPSCQGRGSSLAGGLCPPTRRVGRRPRADRDGAAAARAHCQAARLTHHHSSAEVLTPSRWAPGPAPASTSSPASRSAWHRAWPRAEGPAGRRCPTVTAWQYSRLRLRDWHRHLSYACGTRREPQSCGDSPRCPKYNQNKSHPGITQIQGCLLFQLGDAAKMTHREIIGAGANLEEQLFQNIFKATTCC